MFRRHPGAWKFYRAQPPSYRKMVNWWVISAKQETTRLTRLKTLMDHTARSERVPRFTPGRKKL